MPASRNARRKAAKLRASDGKNLSETPSESGSCSGSAAAESTDFEMLDPESPSTASTSQAGDDVGEVTKKIDLISLLGDGRKLRQAQKRALEQAAQAPAAEGGPVASSSAGTGPTSAAEGPAPPALSPRLESVPEEEVNGEMENILKVEVVPAGDPEEMARVKAGWAREAEELREEDRRSGGKTYACGGCETMTHHLSMTASHRPRHVTRREDGREVPTFFCAACELRERHRDGDATATLQDVEFDIRKQ
jgi:hypothetical protein